MVSDFLELHNLRTEMKEEKEMKGAHEKSCIWGFSVPSFPASSKEPNFSN